MPKYVFRNNNTGEEFELQLKMAEREEYLKENPQIKQIITRSNLASMVGGLKTDEGFKENLARIAAAHPTSELASEYGSKSAAPRLPRAPSINAFTDRILYFSERKMPSLKKFFKSLG